MALNPTDQNKTGIVLANYDGTADAENWPGGDKPVPEGARQVTITGADFGPEPNIVFYRDFDSYSDGDPIPLAAGEGEIGDFTLAEMTVTTMHGYKVAKGFSNNDQDIIEYAVPAMQRFSLTNAITVPVGGHMPGRDNTGVEIPSGDSGWKPVWLLNKSGSNSNNTEADLCVPTHIGGGAFSVAGNTITTGLWYWGYNDQIQENWDWDGLNIFSCIQDCGADPINDLATQYRIFTSEKLAPETTKTTGTVVKSEEIEAFRDTGNPKTLLPENANYGLVRINSFARTSATNPELTQCGFTYLYCAAESTDGANDYRQGVLVGNASTIENCTHLKPKVPDTWSSTEVKVTVLGSESWATHAFVRKPDMSYEVLAL